MNMRDSFGLFFESCSDCHGSVDRFIWSKAIELK